jgi:predicted RNA polymerase sigma factor
LISWKGYRRSVAITCLPNVQGDLLDKLGRREEARVEFARAATMTQNERERQLLTERANETP